MIEGTLENTYLKQSRKEDGLKEQIKRKALFPVQYRDPNTMNYVEKLLKQMVLLYLFSQVETSRWLYRPYQKLITNYLSS